VPITKYVEKEVEVIKQVPLELEDWSSLEEELMVCNYERLLDESEKDKIFHIYVNQGNEYPKKDLFEMLTEAQDSKTVTIRDREWFKWAEDMASKIKVEALKEVDEWLQTKCGNMPKLNRNRCQQSKNIVRISTKELEALKQSKMLKDEY